MQTLRDVLLRLHCEMAVDYLQGWITHTHLPHNCLEKGGEYMYIYMSRYMSRNGSYGVGVLCIVS